MGRVAKPPKGKPEAKRSLASKSPKDDRAKIRDLEKRLAEALEQQAATAEILRTISSSPTNLQTVMDTVAANAARLCGANDAQIFRLEGDNLRRVARFGTLPTVERIPLTRAWVAGRAVIDCQTIHVLDRAVEVETQFPEGREAQRRAGHRTTLAIPLFHEDAAIGSIFIARTEVHPFSDEQIAVLKTFADQAVIAMENVRLFTELEARNRDLTATSEILRVISSSPADVQPVFDTIVESAARLCDAVFSALGSFDGELMDIVAAHNWTPAAWDVARRTWPAPPSRALVTGRAILERAVIHVPDVELDRQYDAPEMSRTVGFRSILSIPMMRDDRPLGVIAVGRAEPGPFSDNQIALLKTFADQAVIAIENVRLFTELHDKNGALTAAHAELTEALERQSATSEILRVISSSPTAVQPVFDAIVQSALRLLEGVGANVARLVGEELHLAAFTTTGEAGDSAISAAYPMPISGGWNIAARAVRARAPVYLADTETDAEYRARGGSLRLARGVRSIVAVPMMSQNSIVGTIAVSRREPGSFSDKEIALLQTFAEQTVIAIENVRLFTELRASNRELTTALDTQTATSDILRVISRSQADVQPVFDAIVASAVRLLGAYSGGLTRVVADQITLVALTSIDHAGDAAQRARYPQPLQSQDPHAHAIRERAPFNIADTQTDPRLPETAHAAARARGFRGMVAVPMLRHDEAIGAITVSRREPGGFTDDEIALLQTFADQAVIAIENARLLSELHARTAELTQSVGELRALNEVGQAISSTLDLQTVLSTIVARATQLAGADAGIIYEYDAEREVFEPRATEHLAPEIVEVLVTAPVRKGEGATGQLAISPETVQLPDIHTDSLPSLHHARGAFLRAGYRALLAVPLLREDHLIGGLTVVRKVPGEFPHETIELLQTFATQSALAIQNARLFREIEDKSRQLEAASQHKSEFLANMSHELRTPLNAIIGFSEVLIDRMFGELNERQEEYLKDVYASGQHLLSLINDILDLSKIEAGRMELAAAEFDLPSAIDNALILVRERASRRGITLGRTIDDRLGMLRGDERKVKQVLLNLLSNALKFTPEGGRIDISARVHDEVAEVSVADTGVGIAPGDQEAVFEEFRQVGTADKKVEGTGLGLALSRKFIELHGGRIWVKSQVGTGSTFTFTIPVHREPSDRGGAAPALNS